MNKKLIALAVAGAFALPMAAQAEVTIFGKMHVSVDSFDNDNSDAAEDSGAGVSNNSSHIGFKGSEDLGNGMKAIWQITNFINVTDNNGGTNWANGNTFVGLTGNFGTGLVGRHDTPYKSIGRKVDLFGDTVGDSRTVINQGMDARANNAIVYVSPSMNGLQAAIAYVTDFTADTTDDNDSDAYSLSLTYSNGPLWLGLAHQQVSRDVYNTAASLDAEGFIEDLADGDALADAYAANTTAATEGSDDRESTRLAGSYAMGDLTFTALWQQDDSIGGVNNADRDVWGLGAAYKMGNNAIKAQYYTADETDGGNDNGWDKWAIGFDHSMSKRTSVYAAYAQVDNESAATTNVTATSGHGDGGPAGAAEAGGDPRAFSVGLVHSF